MKNTVKKITSPLFFYSLVVFFSTFNQHLFANNLDFSSLDQLIKNEIADKHFKGIVLVKQNDKILYSKVTQGPSLVRAENKDEHTPYPIASLTKQMTAVATLRLIERGKLAFTQKLCLFLKECPSSWQDITIKQLLTHSSGIADYTQHKSFNNIKNQDLSQDSMLNIMQSTPLVFVSGKKASYSNSNYYLLGLIIEKAASTSLKKIFTSLFAHAQMSNASLTCSHIPRGHKANNTPLTQSDYVSASVSWAAGGVCASARDLLSWNSSLYNHKLLTKKSMAILTNTEMGFAMGLFIDDINNKTKLIHHSGRIDGFSSELGFIPQQQLSYVVLANVESTSAALIKQHIVGLFETKTTNHHVLTKLTGLFQMERKGINTKITLLNNTLYGQFPGMPPTPLIKDENGFQAKNLPIKIKFENDEYGEVKTIRVNFNGRIIRGKKIAEIPVKIPASVSIEDLNKLIGRYKVNDSFIVEISIKNNALYAQVQGQEGLALEAESRQTFFNAAIDLVVKFESNQKSIIDRLIILQGPIKKVAKKMKVSE
ncbi:serine hydrolase domain-containing protein [Thalassotalea marina]|uniref:Beta-lactamase-related domain-containing protein n=1 Tax=Thalassotalea marina TaxID=1673741 RepID=A0A919BDE3_9GAMM|nr:serine hydrolase domain-containing protein [Thalassotalea marina]GHF83149.1 hypothetical protein GCM10017161_08010 [Thalassotalea marina]